MPNLSQYHIFAQFIRYLEQNNRDVKIINKFKVGGCSGVSTLYLYAKWLEGQPVREDKDGKPIPRDDIQWLNRSLSMVAEWDGESSLNAEEMSAFEHLIAKILYFQYILEYLPIQQGALHRSLSDTRRRECKLEYQLTARFTFEELFASIHDIIPEEKLTLIDSHDHTVGILKRNGAYFYIDPNQPKGMIELSSKTCGVELDEKQKAAALSLLIFQSYGFNGERPSPLAFRIFGIQQTKEDKMFCEKKEKYSYPPSTEIMQKLTVFQDTYKEQADNYADNWNELQLASHQGDLLAVQHILKNHSPAKNKEYLNKGNMKGDSALDLAAQEGHDEITELLIKAKADVHHTCHAGGTALIRTATRNHPSIVAKLLAAGAKANEQVKDHGLTALMLSAIEGCQEVVDLLLDAKADINLESREHLTALGGAAENGQAHMVEHLVKRGANFTGRELIAALDNKHNYVANKLLRLGADPSQALMRLTAEYVADPTTLLKLGATYHRALRYAAQCGETDSISSLVEQRADIQQADSLGYTPLMLAAKHNHIQSFKKLIDHGATPNEGWQAWLRVAERKGIDIINLVIHLIQDYIHIQKTQAIRESVWNKMFGHSRIEKTRAADAMIVSLISIRSRQVEMDLNQHRAVLNAELKHLYDLYEMTKNIKLSHSSAYRFLQATRGR